MIKHAPRLLIAGTGSGCGKTTTVCAILQALKNRGYDVASFKCGPDYIDPMFHSEIIGAQSTNIDLFFSREEQARSLFVKHAAQLNIIEGVMGYYDGLAMDSPKASAWHLAQVLDAPAILVVNVRGMALSAAAVVKGYQEMRKPNGIKGVILNQASPMTYPLYKRAIETECGVEVFGYLPPMPECALESRHLGLVTAQEISDIQAKMQLLAARAEASIDLNGLIELMEKQKPIRVDDIPVRKIGCVKIAVAQDKAFCFYYRDNLEMLEEMGAELIPFSPLCDEYLPHCHGLILGGGYPELYLEQLSRNRSMLESIRNAIGDGLPAIAECGGFMYLTDSIGGHPMAGVIHTNCSNKKRLTRFGYTTIAAEKDSLLLAAGDAVRGHEFHYWDAEKPGAELTARKPSGREWKCAYATDTLYAGYPHLYFHSNPRAAERFMKKSLERKMLHETHGN